MSSFANLFQPGTIGTLVVKNRIIMPAMGTQLADAEGRVTQRLLDYYRARAQGGAGLITPQFASVSADATLPFTMPIYHNSHIDDWRKLADTVHEAGSKICIQLMHIGMLFIYSGFVPEGMVVKAPSLTTWLKNTLPYEEISVDDIDRYVEDFAQAARRAVAAGADVLELHACHGCLVSSFMSPITNRRKDEYGGSNVNRARFARRIVERMRQELGPAVPIMVRMNACDDLEGGITIDEAIEQATILEAAGADAINVSSGLEYWTTLSIPTFLFPEGPMVPFATMIKQGISVPVVAAGKIGPEYAASVINEEKADFVALGRPLLADPELPNKLREDRIDDVRRCIYCNNCLKSATDPAAGPMSCSVNPFVSREARYPYPATPTPKRIMVAGGGLAGMETAIYLKERGHQVTLYERETQLGGQWNVACASPGKEGYRALSDYLIKRLAQLAVPIHVNTEVTTNMVMEHSPDAVVIATGAVPTGLPVPGADKPHVVQGHDVLAGKVPVKGKCAVIGGRFIGIEAAIMLAEKNYKVSIITKAGLGENGVKLEKFNLQTLGNRLFDLDIPLYLNSTVVEITDRSVFIAMGGEIYPVRADTVILSVGMRSVDSLARELEGSGLAVYKVGDCVQPKDAADVSYQAARLASTV